MSKVLGVLGGMGPAATLDFLAKLQAATPVVREQDHIRVLVDINPKIPDRNTDGDAAGPVLAAMAAGLRDAGAEVLAIACNTGLRTRGGPREIGNAVTRSVVFSLVTILILDYFVTAILLVKHVTS